MKSFKQLVQIYVMIGGTALIIIFSIALYSNYKNNSLKTEYNVTENDTLVKCQNGSYEKITPTTITFCGGIVNKIGGVKDNSQELILYE